MKDECRTLQFILRPSPFILPMGLLDTEAGKRRLLSVEVPAVEA